MRTPSLAPSVIPATLSALEATEDVPHATRMEMLRAGPCAFTIGQDRPQMDGRMSVNRAGLIGPIRSERPCTRQPSQNDVPTVPPCHSPRLRGRIPLITGEDDFFVNPEWIKALPTAA